MMVVTAQRHRKFVADLASKGSRLSEFQMVGIAGRALADQAGLRAYKCQVGLVAASDLLAQRRRPGFGVLVLGGHCNSRRLSGTAASIGWRNRHRFSWVLLNSICAEIQLVEHDLTSGLDGARIVGRERVLGRQAPVRPQGDIVARCSMMSCRQPGPPRALAWAARCQTTGASRRSGRSARISFPP